MYTVNEYITKLVDDERTGYLRREAASHRLAGALVRGRRGQRPGGGRGQPGHRAWVPRQRRHLQEGPEPSAGPKDAAVYPDQSARCAA